MNNYIELTSVSYDYPVGDSKTRGVKDVTLSIEEGEFVVVLGHNGSGKSTLAKLLSGFIAADRGSVMVADIDASDEDTVFNLRQNVGMVFQNPDNQTVASIIEDDIAFGPENLGIEPAEIRRRVDWALDAVNMTEYAGHTPFKLSGGQKQRIAIAAILAMMPKTMILDESTSMLDPKGRAEIMDIVKRLNKEEGMTIILITHYMDEAVDADKIIVMKNGEVLKVGRPKEVFGDAKLVESTNLDMPIAPKVAGLIKDVVDVGTVLTDEELVEALCQSR